MVATPIIVVTVGIVVILSYYIYLEYRAWKYSGAIQKVRPLQQGAVIIDYLNRLEAEVGEVRFEGKHIIIKYLNGQVIQYEKEIFQLLNTFDVFIGKPAIFTYGDKQAVDRNSILKVIDDLKQQIGILRAQSSEQKNREVTQVLDAVQKSNARRGREDYHDR